MDSRFPDCVKSTINSKASFTKFLRQPDVHGIMYHTRKE